MEELASSRAPISTNWWLKKKGPPRGQRANAHLGVQIELKNICARENGSIRSMV